MKSVAFICKFSWVGISTSLINSAIFWESKGYLVDIYTEKPDQGRFPLPDFGKKNISFIITHINEKSIIDDFLFLKYFPDKNYEWVIGFDHLGFIRAGITAFFKKRQLIYHSLEFFEPSNRSFKNRIIKWVEILLSYKAKFIFAQDSYRIRFLESDLKQNSKKFKIVFNTPITKISEHNTNYFRELFGISESKKIILFIGSLIKEHYIIELVDSISTWNEQFVLVLHGWFPEKAIRDYIFNKIECHPDKIFVSEKLFNEDDKWIPFHACDIGFVGFLPISNNLKYAAGSAGKIFDFLNAGKPMLAFDTPGMKDLIELNEVGKTFNIQETINTTLLEIIFHYKKYSANTNKVFNKYCFTEQYSKVFAEITSYKQ